MESGEGPEYNTVDATLGNSFGTKPILQLPFEGRNVAKMLSLQAGVSWVGDTDSVNGGVSVATDRGGVVNGGRSDQSNLTLDGVDNNNQQTRQAFTTALLSQNAAEKGERVIVLMAMGEDGAEFGVGGGEVALFAGIGGVLRGEALDDADVAEQLGKGVGVIALLGEDFADPCERECEVALP